MKQLCNFRKIVASLSLVTLLGASLLSPFSFAATTGDKTAAQTVADMGIGWNLGNTLEACGSTQTTVQGYETLWGNPVTTQKMIDGLKAAGFNSVRIPVAWSNLMGANYTINTDLLKRVGEVANYCLNDDMYCIVNIHWDNGWFANFSTSYDESMKKYTSVWTQISSYFKNYSNKLIFESLNEEGCWNDIWNRYSGASGDSKTRAYNILNNINQNFVNILRASGGNNASRCLLIAGYATDIDLTCDDCFKMPKDTVSSKLMISVHYYTPATFTLLTADADWGKAAYTWGTTQEINVVKTDFNKMKTKFANNGVPVIVGEYNATTTNKDPASVRLYISTVCQTTHDLGFCPFLWDAGEHYSRNDAKFRDSQLAAFFLKYKVNTTPPSTKLGDISHDGNINSTDYSLMKRYILGTTTFTDDMLTAADLNGDGKVNSNDLSFMKRYLLGQISSFPKGT